MRAGDLAVEVPTVRVGDPATRAVRIMTDEQLPGLIVVDEADRPRFVIPGSQVLRMLVSHYSGDAALARTIDEEHADEFWTDLGTRTVGDCMAPDRTRPAQVLPDATLLEVAVAMSGQRSPLVAVVDTEQRLLGCITLNALLTRLALPPG